MVIPPVRLQVPGAIRHGRRTQSSMNDVRVQNQQAVIEAILGERLTSRKDLCRITGLSASTVGLIVNQFIERGVLLESGAGVSERGRKPINIGINANAGTVLAIDVNELCMGLYDLHLRPLLTDTSFYLKQQPTPDDVVQLIKKGLASLPEGVRMPLVIGVSVPASVDTKTGTVVRSTNLEWESVSLGNLIARETGIPTVVESNMVCLSLTEAWTGIASGIDDFAYIHMGWRGVGAGLMLGGEVYKGNNLRAAEIGHIQVDEKGPICMCGRRGCLETVASGRSTVKRAGIQVSGQTGQDHNKAWHQLLQAADSGEAKAISALEETAVAISRAVAMLVRVIDPSMLVFGGRLMEAQEFIMPIVKQKVKEHLSSVAAADLRIEVALDSREKSIAGAAQVALRSYLLHMV